MAQLDPAWGPLTVAPGQALLGVDFDGSLAPIVDDPARAAPLPEAVRALCRLAAAGMTVAVVTGRPVQTVRAHVADPAVEVIGQYGLERDRGGAIEVDARAEAYVPAVAGAAAVAATRWPECMIEHKGRLAFTVHWRTAPGAAPAPADLAALAADHGLATLPGRMACELRPPLPVDKGTALATLLAEHDVAAAAFAGDDHGDLAAFTALDTWADAGSGRAARSVAVGSTESPPELLARADLVLSGPPALAEQLTLLADALD